MLTNERTNPTLTHLAEPTSLPTPSPASILFSIIAIPSCIFHNTIPNLSIVCTFPHDYYEPNRLNRTIKKSSPFLLEPFSCTLNLCIEGKFYRRKLVTHPHTNMAKAALNMMTVRTLRHTLSHPITPHHTLYPIILIYPLVIILNLTLN